MIQGRKPKPPKLFWIGLGMLVLGSGPLLLIIIAAELGLWPDPNPNPVGPGILAMLTFWPGIVLTMVGVGLGCLRWMRLRWLRARGR